MKTNYFFKKLSLLVSFLFLMGYSALACNYTISLHDSYGDGWNGGTITVKVNGVTVINTLTLVNGTGPLDSTFAVSTGDIISTVYVGGSYTSENGYEIKDALGTVVATDGYPTGTPSGITSLIAACPVANDAAMVGIIVPMLSGNAAVKAIIKNGGTATLTSATINWTVDGTAQTTYSYTGSLANNVTDTVTLGSYNFTPGSHTVVAASSLPNGSVDGNTANDTITNVSLFVGPHTLPLTEDFESGFDKFDNASGNDVDFAIETTIVHNGTQSVKNVATTSNENILVETGVLDLSTASNMVLDFWHIAKTEGNWDKCYVEVSTDGGVTYTAIPDSAYQGNSTNYSTKGYFHEDSYTEWGTGNQTPNNTWWKNETFSLSAYYTSNVRFRFRYTTDGSTERAGWFIDDIKIYQLPANDMKMLSWDAPMSSIDYSSGNVVVSVYNNGTAAQSNIPVAYSTDAGTTIIYDTITSTVNSGDTLQFTFSTPATFTSGLNDCGAVVSNGDAIPSNDSVFFDMTNYALPYINDFENEVANIAPNGWVVANDLGNASAYVKVYNSSYYAHTGNHILKLYNYNSTSGSLIGSLPYYGGTPLTDKWITFWHRGYSSDVLIVGVMTDATDSSTFVAVDTISPVDGSYHKYAVSFTNYSGTGKYVSFKHGLGGTYHSLYIDDLTFETAPVGAVYTVTPDTNFTFGSVRYNYPDTLTQAFTITNNGIGNMIITQSVLGGANDTNFVYMDTNTYPKTLAMFESLTFDVKFGGSSIGTRTATLSLTHDGVNADITLTGNVVDPIISNFPYVENFDDQAVDLGWSLQGGSYKWQFNNGQTGSSNTGPLGDLSGSGYYIYTEASSGSLGDVASIYTNPVDMSSLSGAKLNYWYHMYGATIDTFSVEIAQNGAWTVVDTINGQQQAAMSDPWLMHSVDLSAYAATLIDSVRFKAIRGSSYTGDISIDNIAFGSDPVLSLNDTSVCGSTPIVLDATIAGNYTYTWTDLATNTVVGNADTLSVTSSGDYAVTVVDAGYFTATDTVTVIFYSTPSASFTGLDSAYCTYDMASTLVGTPSTGVFSGNGVTGTSFDPMAAGAGTHIVSYAVTDATTGCVGVAMDTTDVFAAAVPTVTPDLAICNGDSATLTVSASSVAGGVFFSEYIEGSSNNKAIEIYNATGATINLDEYSIMTNYNGNPWSGQYHFPAGATLAAGDVFVVANDAADSLILAVADDSLHYNAGGYVVGFNGDDVRALFHKTSATDSAMIDIIGAYDGVDPGKGWDVAGVSEATKDHSLIRKGSVMFGDTSWVAIAGTDSASSQYLVYPKNDFGFIGSHTIAGGSNTYLWSTGETTETITVNPTTTTTYTVVVDNGHCQATDSVVVTVNAVPVVNLGNDTTIKWTAGSVTLDAGNPNATWLWNTGSTTQTETFDQNNLTNAAANTVYVTVTENNCSASDTLVITVMDDVSINGALDNMDINVYPNPTKGQFNMAINGFEGNLDMTIVNLAGQTVYSEKINVTPSYVNKFDVSTLSTGVYYIKLTTENGIKVLKLVIR